MKELKQYLEAGKIVNTQGLRGELRVESWCDSPAFLCGFRRLYWQPQGEPVRVLSARVHKSLALLRLEGVETVEQADRLRGRVLYFNRQDANLPQGRHFVQDLLGLEVVDADTGRSYGELTDLFKTGANDVYQVTDRRESGAKDYLVPVIDEVVIRIAPEEGKVYIRPIKGIFDDAD